MIFDLKTIFSEIPISEVVEFINLRSIKKYGVELLSKNKVYDKTKPIVVRRLSDDVYKLIDGGHRFIFAKDYLKLQYIPAIIIENADLSYEQAVFLANWYNVNTESHIKTTFIDIIKLISLLKDKELTIDKIADIFKDSRKDETWSKSKVENYSALLSGIYPDVWKKIIDYEETHTCEFFSEGLLRYILGLTDNQQEELILSVIRDQDKQKFKEKAKNYRNTNKKSKDLTVKVDAIKNTEYKSIFSIEELPVTSPKVLLPESKELKEVIGDSKKVIPEIKSVEMPSQYHSNFSNDKNEVKEPVRKSIILEVDNDFVSYNGVRIAIEDFIIKSEGQEFLLKNLLRDNNKDRKINYENKMRIL